VGCNYVNNMQQDLRNLLYQMIFEGIKDNGIGLFRSYSLLWGILFALELMVILTATTLCPRFYSAIFMFCYGIGNSICLAITTSIFQTTDKKISVLISMVLGCIISSCCYIYLSEIAILGSKQIIQSLKGEKTQENLKNNIKNSSVKLFYITAILSISALIFTLIRLK